MVFYEIFINSTYVGTVVDTLRHEYIKKLIEDGIIKPKENDSIEFKLIN